MLVNCDVCGRLRNLASDPGHHIGQTGGYACSSCGIWAGKKQLKCPVCAGSLAHGPYDGKCTCDPPPRITRSGRHHSIGGAT